MGQAAGCAGLMRQPYIDEDEAPETDKRPKIVRRLSLISGLVDTKGTDDLTKAGYSDDALSTEENRARGKMNCGVRTKKGFVPGNPGKVNQDRFVVKWGLQKRDDVSLFGAFDGHGPVGQEISQYVATNLPIYLENQENLLSDPKKAIMEATAKLCARLKVEKKDASRFSGTTAVFAIKIQNKIYTANIGDSRSVLCTRVGSDSFQSIALSEDHKPETPSEKKRILAAGGRVHALKGFYGPAGPERVWLKTQDIPGLAMSRSIGDGLAHTVGVLDVPTITEYEVSSLDKFVVWASDGVWDFMPNHEIGHFCSKYAPDMDAAAAAIVKRACSLWEKNEQVVDDITIVALQLHGLD
mmetsp:Transcript_3821/g.6004  ORF Transcript_3821/g.6004 Transcript_3821/m.6004 type:complete len:354 (+) Transcript_3821:73-1134(+)